MISSRHNCNLLSWTVSPIKHLSPVLERLILLLPQLLLIPLPTWDYSKIELMKMPGFFHPWNNYTLQKTIFWGFQTTVLNLRLQKLNHFINNVQDRDMSKVTQAGS